MARRLALIVVTVVAGASLTAQLSAQRTPPPPPPQPTTSSTGIAQLPPLSGIAQLPPMGGITQLPRSTITSSPAPAGSVDVFQARPRTYAPRYNRGNQRYLQQPFGYTTGYAFGPYSDSAPEQDRRNEAPVEFGFLRLNVSPAAAQVYIDGFYVSSVDTFSGAGPSRAIEVGPHRVEIRADGYETATFDVRIAQNETTTYSRDLDRREEPRQARNVTPATPKTFYVIPKCYAGDKKPEKDQLPKGCQPLNVRTIPPVVKSAR